MSSYQKIAALIKTNSTQRITAVRVVQISIGTEHVDNPYYPGYILLLAEFKAVGAIGANTLALFVITCGKGYVDHNPELIESIYGIGYRLAS